MVLLYEGQLKELTKIEKISEDEFELVFEYREKEEDSRSYHPFNSSYSDDERNFLSKVFQNFESYGTSGPKKGMEKAKNITSKLFLFPKKPELNVPSLKMVGEDPEKSNLFYKLRYDNNYYGYSAQKVYKTVYIVPAESLKE